MNEIEKCLETRGEAWVTQNINIKIPKPRKLEMRQIDSMTIANDNIQTGKTDRYNLPRWLYTQVKC